MARTQDEITRDDQIINLLKNIWNELKQLNKKLGKKNGTK